MNKPKDLNIFSCFTNGIKKAMMTEKNNNNPIDPPESTVDNIKEKPILLSEKKEEKPTSPIKVTPVEKVKSPIKEEKKEIAPEKTLTREELFQLKIKKYKEEEERKENEKKKALENLAELNRQKRENELNIKGSLWTLKHSPYSSNDFFGNLSSISKLKEWIISWNSKHLNEIRTNDDNDFDYENINEKSKINSFENINAKACLLSGPPGIGKTTSARVICEELGYKTYELNASDHRNKEVILSKVGFLSNNSTIKTLTNDKDKAKEFHNNSKNIIIMDEVDGLAGNEDKGGIKAIIEVIKMSRVPIICICNERSDMKLKSLINQSYEIKFVKPERRQILNLLLKIKNKEKLLISEKEMEEIAEFSQGDLRQAINLIENWYLRYKIGHTNREDMAKLHKESIANKDSMILLNPFEAATKLMTRYDMKNLSFTEKLNLYFIDSEFIPDLIHENYLSSILNQKAKSFYDLEKLSKSADSLSYADMIDCKIKKEGHWSLLTDKGIFSSILTPSLISSNQVKFCKFPGIISLNSKLTRRKRLINELKKASNNSSNEDIIKGFCPLAMSKIIKLLNEGKEGINECLKYMVNTRLDLIHIKENIYELCDEAFKKKFDLINPSIKTTFTKKYNELYKTMKRAAKLKKGKEEANDDDSDTIIE